MENYGCCINGHQNIFCWFDVRFFHGIQLYVNSFVVLWLGFHFLVGLIPLTKDGQVCYLFSKMSKAVLFSWLFSLRFSLVSLVRDSSVKLSIVLLCFALFSVHHQILLYGVLCLYMSLSMYVCVCVCIQVHVYIAGTVKAFDWNRFSSGRKW